MIYLPNELINIIIMYRPRHPLFILLNNIMKFIYQNGKNLKDFLIFSRVKRELLSKI
jgi:hypothetical protein